MRTHRKKIQMVFQDPFGSLNPRQKVARRIAQGPMVHGMAEREALDLARELLRTVGRDPRAADRFPPEFSGGPRTRDASGRATCRERVWSDMESAVVARKQ